MAADPGALRGGVLLRQVGQALAVSGLAPERLEIELSEAALAIDTSDTLLTLAALRDLAAHRRGRS